MPITIDELRIRLDRDLDSGHFQEGSPYLRCLLTAIERLEYLGDEEGLAHIRQAYEFGGRYESVRHARVQSELNERISAANSARRAQAKTVGCPKCGAAAGRACRTTSGQRAEEPHAARLAKAGV